MTIIFFCYNLFVKLTIHEKNPSCFMLIHCAMYTFIGHFLTFFLRITSPVLSINGYLKRLGRSRPSALPLFLSWSVNEEFRLYVSIPLYRYVYTEMSLSAGWTTAGDVAFMHEIGASRRAVISRFLVPLKTHGGSAVSSRERS